MMMMMIIIIMIIIIIIIITPRLSVHLPIRFYIPVPHPSQSHFTL
jgi:hypothetical protein